MTDFSSEDYRFMAKALQLAHEAAALGEIPVGAIVVASGKIVGEGFNQPISRHDPSAHAEIQALRSAGLTLQNYRLINATLYVTLEPCTMCAGAMIHARINRLVYAATEPKAGVARSQQAFFSSPFLNHQIDVDGGLMADEASQLLSQFFKKRREVKKNEKNSVNYSVIN
jgi:tRNA(Arg) A34 adenosine deaminase TadA